MLLQLISRISTGMAHDSATAQQETGASLHTLLCEVQCDIARTERAFDLAEDDILIDNIIYRLKALTAQQQFLVQNIRRLEGVNAVKEGYLLG